MDEVRPPDQLIRAMEGLYAQSVLHYAPPLSELVSDYQLLPLTTKLVQGEPFSFTPLRNKIPRVPASGKAVEFRPIRNFYSAGYSYNQDGEMQLREISLMPAPDIDLHPYVKRISEQLRAQILGQEDDLLSGIGLRPAAERQPRIIVVEAPPIYDPSNPDKYRAYVRHLYHTQGLSPEKIQRWCAALTWSQITDAIS